MTTIKPKLILFGSTGFIGTEIQKNDIINTDFEILSIRHPDEIRQIKNNWLSNSTLLNFAGKTEGSSEDMWMANVLAARNAVKIFLNCGGRKIVHASSVAVYSNPMISRGSRENDPHEPDSYYGFTKSLSEKIVVGECSQVPNASYIILRLPNIFGEAQNKGVIYNFVSKIRQNENIILHGDGGQMRDFLHVKDLILLLREILRQSLQSNFYNLSSSFSVTMKELAILLKKNSTSNSKLIYEITEKDPISLKLDNTKAKNEFGEFCSNTLQYCAGNFNWERDF